MRICSDIRPIGNSVCARKMMGCESNKAKKSNGANKNKNKNKIEYFIYPVWSGLEGTSWLLVMAKQFQNPAAYWLFSAALSLLLRVADSIRSIAFTVFACKCKFMYLGQTGNMTHLIRQSYTWWRASFPLGVLSFWFIIYACCATLVVLVLVVPCLVWERSWWWCKQRNGLTWLYHYHLITKPLLSLAFFLQVLSFLNLLGCKFLIFA